MTAKWQHVASAKNLAADETATDSIKINGICVAYSFKTTAVQAPGLPDAGEKTQINSAAALR